MKTALRVVAFVLTYFFLMFGLLYVFRFLPPYSEFTNSVVTVSIVFFHLSVFGVFLTYRHRTRKRWVLEEADRWLAERKLAESARTIKLRRSLLWRPFVRVAIASLFVPETIGWASHWFRGRTVNMGNLQIETPTTWIEWSRGKDYLGIMTVPGIGRIGFKRYWNHDVPLSEMVFFPVPHPELNFFRNVPLEGQTVLAKRSFLFGKETLTCWDLVHSNPFMGPWPKDHSIADISCSTESDHFYAHFRWLEK